MSMKGLSLCAGMAFLSASAAQSAEINYKGLIREPDIYPKLGIRTGSAYSNPLYTHFSFEGMPPQKTPDAGGAMAGWPDVHLVPCDLMLKEDREYLVRNLAQLFIGRAEGLANAEKVTGIKNVPKLIDQAIMDCSPKGY